MSLISGLLNQKIDYIYSVTTDGYGDETTTEIYSTVACRWQENIQKVMNINSEEVMTSIQVWLPSTYSNISYNWRFSKDSVIYTIQRFSKHYDLGGQLDYIKVYLN